MCMVLTVTVIIPAPRAEAGILGLQTLVDSLSNCKNISQGTNAWNQCEETQNLLHWFADCSDKMFGPKDKNGKRSISQKVIDECQAKINGDKPVERSNYLLSVIRECKEVSVTSTFGAASENGSIATLIDDNTLDPKDWDQCESAQIGLTKLYGEKCDKLFDKIERSFNEDQYSFNVDRTNACEEAIKTAQKAPATKPGEGKDTSGGANTVKDADCQATGFGLGWIICPIFELGANLTNDVFRELIAPLLENVPVSTEPSDPVYQAWKQFRTLGNIILIGSLLAIVYAQTRGDR